jgi:beta-glucosidase
MHGQFEKRALWFGGRLALGVALTVPALGCAGPAAVQAPPAVQAPAQPVPAPPSPAPTGPPADAAFLNPDLPLPERVDDLIRRMTLDEKIAQLMDEAPELPRLGVPKYGWWSEALHGVARAGVATVFPQAIALAATFDEPFMHKVADVISTEARAKHHEFVRQGRRGRYQGLTFFSPNINIFRDPRWGRGHETFGEDPHLTGRMGVAFIKGMQGDDPKYMKVAATAKHYAVHSGPEKDRHKFDARVTKRELWDTYLPHFELAVREAKVASFMSAYNAVDGKPASASDTLLDQILRKRWGFDGYVVTDCGAIRDVWRDHKVAKDSPDAGAMSIKAGTDLECGRELRNLGRAVKAGQIGETEIDRALKRLFTSRFKLGMFDPAERVPFARIPISENDKPAHRQLALEAARKAIVLLENKGALPIKASVKKLAVIGPTADNQDVLVGNYNGTPSRPVTLLAGIQQVAAARGLEFSFSRGSNVLDGSDAQRAEAVATAKWADLVVLTVGLTPKEEGEEGESKLNPSGDKNDITLPPAQEKLMEAIIGSGRPVVLVLTGGSNIASPWFKKARAVLLAWYPGGEGGTAVGEILFGDVNPAGRLPLTFYASLKDLPAFTDYGMKNRTYRYYTGEPLWPFGHGKSYTTFKYGALKVSRPIAAVKDGGELTVAVQNTGGRAGDEVVQVYVTDEKASVTAPLRSLVWFTRVSLAAGETKTLQIPLTGRALSVVDEQGQRMVEPGFFTVAVGGGQPSRGGYRSANEGATIRIEVKGEVTRLN